MNTMSSALREELHQLLDQLNDEQLEEAEQRLREIEGDPFEDMDPEERKKLHASLDQAEADIAAGRTRPVGEFLNELRAR
ncbi:MAG: hypothetical protein AAFZ38_11680 [Myxococcota bacterium]